MSLDEIRLSKTWAAFNVGDIEIIVAQKRAAGSFASHSYLHKQQIEQSKNHYLANIVHQAVRRELDAWTSQYNGLK
jgi:hypothetical protein